MKTTDNFFMENPSSFLPVVMSVTAVAMVLGHVALFGVDRQADEGTAAHLWQLLMACQVPFIGWFAMKWLRRDMKRALAVLGVQALAFLAALAPVYFLGL